MQTSKHIATWLTLGPIYNPGHQTDNHYADDGHPKAADIIQDIDKQPIDPKALTTSLEKASAAGETLAYGNGELFPARTYAWRELGFADVDWHNVRDVHDAIHNRLGAGILSNNPDDPDSFAGKHHALVFFLVYVFSPEARTNHLCIRSDDAVRVWLNSGEILPLRYAGDRDIDEQSPESCAKVKLNQGINILLAAVAETHVEWGFSARFENDADLQFLTQKPDNYSIQGTVSDTQGNPLDKLLVRVYDKDLRHEQLLSETLSDKEGAYSITYTQAQSGHSEENSLNIILRVFDQNDNLLTSSKTVFNAKPVETVDIVVLAEHYLLQSKYERITRTLRPLLTERSIYELREDEDDDPKHGKFQDLSYLYGETGITVTHLSQLVVAEKLGIETQVVPEIFYGLFRKGIPTDLYAIGEQSKKAIRETLEQALKERLLPDHLSGVLEEELNKLFALPEITLLKKPLFLIKPEVLFKPLTSLTTLGKPERNLVDAKLNRKFRDLLINSAGILSESMHNALQSAVERLEYTNYLDSEPSKILRDTVLAAIKKIPELSEEVVKIEQNLSERVTGASISHLLNLDQPLQNNPIFITEIRRAKTLAYSTLANMSEAAQTHLADSNLEPDDRALGELINQGLASEEQALDLRLVLDLARLTGDNLPLMQNVKNSDLKSTMEMVHWSREDWLRRITLSSDSLPLGENPESYVDNILSNIEQTYPSQILLSRILNPEHTGRVTRLDRLQPLLVECERLIDGRKPAAIDWQSVTVADPESLQCDLAELAAFTNTYRHLGIAELINDKDIILAQKKETISKRLQLLETFNRNNPRLDLRLVNFISQEDDTLNWQAIPENERPLVRRQMMAFQRVLSLAGDTQNRQQLLNTGFDSSRAIASQMLSCFIVESGLAENVARQVYKDARKKTDLIINSVESIREAISGDFNNIGMAGNTGIVRSNLYNALREVDGLEELFGSQNYCACEECRSILSPAAYFVDLMRFIEENISSQVQAKHISFASHSLNLKRRRPDLWKLNLTCENTNTLIPYLTIVNEVLSGYHELVLGTKDVFMALSNKDNKISFHLPFSLPMAELRLYLGHFGITLHGLCRLLDQPKEMFWRARLNLSKQEFDVIIKPDTEQVKYRYGNPDSFNAPALFDVQEFLRRTGIDRDQLDILLALGFNPDLKNIHILKQQNPDEVQTYVEYFSGLTKSRLDFIHRFIRLWRKTEWDLKEMDLVLCALRDDKQILNGIHQATVEHIAHLVDIQQTLQLSVEELCAMFHYLPASPAFPNPPSRASQEQLLERLFDIQALFGGNKKFPYYHYSHDKSLAITAVPMIDSKTPFLLGGLGISETEMLLLFKLLKEMMPFDNGGNTLLNQENLSLLYRHARLAKALKWSVEELVFALQLIFSPSDWAVEKLGQIDQLQEFRDWQKASPFSVYELAFILDEKECNRISYQVNLDGTTNLALECQKYNNLSFAKSVLANLDKVSTENSEILLAKMASDGLLIEVGDGYRIDSLNYRLTQDFDAIFTTLALPDEVTEQRAAIRAKLNEFHPFAIGYTLYANIDQETFEQLIPFVDMDGVDNPITGALQAKFDDDGNPENPDDLQPFLILLKALERIHLLFDQLKFKADDIRLVTENPDIFGITDLKDLNLDNLKTLVLYRELMPLEAKAKTSMQTVMQDIAADVGFLADIWQVDDSLVNSLKRSLSLPTESVKAIGYLKRTLDCCRLLGVNGFSLKKLVDLESYWKQTKARDIALGAFSSRYEDEKLRSEKLEPYQDKVNTLKRDALCDYIIAREKDLKFEDANDIYNFFLLDVEMSGCFRTSRLVCGLSSLQLYVHRVLANLEQSASGDISVLQDLDEDLLSQIRDEWHQWRQNYRVWEANRKVFLYPENYLEPDLRDNKTPIFKELEEELLQEKITKESAEAAYKKYLTQFAELARLRIAGTYFHADTDTYYFFGRTQQDPPQYYYRTWKKKAWTWTAWQKIDLGINSDYVSAVIHQGKLFLFWVEIKTNEKTVVTDGNSKSLGYTLEISILYTFLNENGRWLSAQRMDNGQHPSHEIQGIHETTKKEFEELKTYSRVYIKQADEGQLYAFIDLDAFASNINSGGGRINFFSNFLDNNKTEDLKSTFQSWNAVNLYNFSNQFSQFGVRHNTGAYTIEYQERFSISKNKIPPFGVNFSEDPQYFINSQYDPDIDLVHNNPNDFIIKLGNQQYLTQWKSDWFFDYRNTIRLTTSLVDRLGNKLMNEGLEAFLSLETQYFEEAPIGVDFNKPWVDFDFPICSQLVKHVNFKGSYGEYYRELFFHIPFLIAHHLNANQKFEEAKGWYEHIFDPTGTETPNSKNPNERNWRYLEFRELSMEKIKDILTYKAAIEKYEEDPFSPHAIARLRLSAYQKTIVMKYIDNLLDWGDSLFARDNMESINEATMLYVLAADILGKRPVELGKCETVSDSNLTFAKIEPHLEEGNDFLMTMENWNLTVSVERPLQAIKDHIVLEEIPNWHSFVAYGGRPDYRMRSYKEKMEVRKELQYQSASQFDVTAVYRSPHISVFDNTRQVFCIPPNKDLLKYWDRVEDRLFKIRHCMNISGVRRQLALFQPPIDPMALVRAKAAGLSMDDILNMMGAQLPPYRFAYLIEKAKQFTQTVQSFGSALVSALEKKDVEELTLLRSVHERNIMNLTQQIKQQQLAEAQCQNQAVVESKNNVQNRINHYSGLIDTGLTELETTQTRSTHAATIFKAAEGILHIAAGIYYLIPNAGSPFAMTYGGEELGDSGVEFAQWTSSMAAVANQIAASYAIEASWDRREQEWNQQLLLAQQELKQVEQQRLAADIRQFIAEKDLENHEKQIEQADELDAFYKNKFTNLGLYTYLSTTLHRLYRQAYNIAYDMARMAEQAYQFERDDNASFFIAGDNWQFDRAGLLAGERLLLQLQQMEKAYLEKNTRNCEVTQSLSLALLDPNELLNLRRNGACEFKIPEIAYDLVYPGQYKRIIKSVRLTIPCISGPHTNIGATLTLKESWIRSRSDQSADLLPVSHQKNTSIATSSSVNDSGVFELNFRDERYLPFEGAGAVSTWGLTLPEKIRQFDYDTISDVVIHVSYTALYSESWKSKVETQIADNLIEYSKTHGLFRMFSLNHEFPDAFHQLFAQPESPQSTEIEIKQQHFPYFLLDQSFSITGLSVFVKRKIVDDLNLSGLTLNGKEITWETNGGMDGIKEGNITPITGSPLGKWTLAFAQGGLLKEQVADIILVVKYSASPNS